MEESGGEGRGGRGMEESGGEGREGNGGGEGKLCRGQEMIINLISPF